MSSLQCPSLLEMLVCPRDHKPLHEVSDALECEGGHRYALVEGIPILLVSEATQTHIEAHRALAIAEGRDTSPLPQITTRGQEIDFFVQNTIAGTNGGFYIPLIGKLKNYPIPDLRLPAGDGAAFLDLGCNW